MSADFNPSTAVVNGSPFRNPEMYSAFRRYVVPRARGLESELYEMSPNLRRTEMRDFYRDLLNPKAFTGADNHTDLLDFYNIALKSAAAFARHLEPDKILPIAKSLLHHPPFQHNGELTLMFYNAIVPILARDDHKSHPPRHALLNYVPNEKSAGIINEIFSAETAERLGKIARKGSASCRERTEKEVGMLYIDALRRHLSRRQAALAFHGVEPNPYGISPDGVEHVTLEGIKLCIKESWEDTTHNL